MILIFAENQDGICKKAAFEAVTYGRKIANASGVDCAALVVGDVTNAGELGIYGAHKVYQVGSGTVAFGDKRYAEIICKVAQDNGASTIVLSHTSSGKTLAGRIAIKFDAGLVSAAISLPTDEGIPKNVFSGKAVAQYNILTEKKVISVQGNSVPPEELGQSVEPSVLDMEIPALEYEILSVEKVTGTVPLPEAELVVSGGRGFKGPENWPILLELAEALGASTACSRPVADMEWRPHHEHVGQTGVAIRPNLYIAIGISGAIQHLGGVNNSKTIVVINKDPEAPFFKAADYGVVGDLFDVVPKLTAAVKELKAS